MNRRETLDLDRYLTRSDDDGRFDEPTFDDPEVVRDETLYLLRRAIDDAVHEFGLHAAQVEAFDRLRAHAGNRPLIIDHIQEPH